jgi:hypothetical protein
MDSLENRRKYGVVISQFGIGDRMPWEVRHRTNSSGNTTVQGVSYRPAQPKPGVVAIECHLDEGGGGKNKDAMPPSLRGEMDRMETRIESLLSRLERQKEDGSNQRKRSKEKESSPNRVPDLSKDRVNREMMAFKDHLRFKQERLKTEMEKLQSQIETLLPE